MPEPNVLLDGPELAAALREYLPPSLERRCLLGDEVRNPADCVSHLAALLRTVSTYLPRQVVIPLLEDPQLGKVEGGFTHGTMMFADISGFTAMSEKLSQLGKEGAEEVTAIINRLFTTLLEVTGHYGGDLLKFGGDALVVYFGGRRYALRAALAALEMQRTMGRFAETKTSQGVFRLRMTIGLGSGPLFMARLGSEEGMEFAVMGRAMVQMAKAEDLAAAGEIFMDSATYRALSEYAPSGEVRQGFCRLIGLGEERCEWGEEITLPDVSPPEGGDLLPWVSLTVRRIRALSLFLPPGLLERIKLEPERVSIGGEYRPVTVFFANFYGIDEIIEELEEALGAEAAGPEITAILNSHFTTMRSIIAKYGGVVNKVDSYAVGHRIMTLFGAPRAHIDDPERAVRAALDMQAAMAEFSQLETSCGIFFLKQRIGINTGLVFAGNVGSPVRQEYSVMGDGVNLAARLMAVAKDGQVVISRNTARQTGDVFLLNEQEPVRVKGKSLPVHNFIVEGVRERRVRERRPMIGRENEWRVAHTITDRSLAGEAQVLVIVGEAGMGKSRFLDELVAHWVEEHRALGISTECPSFGRHTPYLPWLDLLRAFFGFDPADSDAVRLEKITALLREVNPAWEEWSGLIGRLLGLDIPESDLVRRLDPQARKRLIFRIVVGLVRHIASEQPLLLAIDDLHWADDTSIELVNRVARRVKGRPLLLVLSHRPDESLDKMLELSDLPNYTSLRLRELSREDGARLLDVLLPTTPQMPEQLRDLILASAQGNPLFIEEVAHSLIEDYLVLDEKSGTYHTRPDIDVEQIEVPDTVNRVIMSRIDRLYEGERNVLKVASVIGREFQYWLLSTIYPYRYTNGELMERLDALTRREILEGVLRTEQARRFRPVLTREAAYESLLHTNGWQHRRDAETAERQEGDRLAEYWTSLRPEMLHRFRHVLTREVAYESLLYADRRQLHRRIAEAIERQKADRLTEYWEVLAYHFGQAEVWDKALDYHLKAAQKAQSVYANDDAIHHFRRALEAAEKVGNCVLGRLAAHEGLGEVLDTLGEYDEALVHLQQARALVTEAELSGDEKPRRLAELCRKMAAIYEKQSDYDAAFEWLHKGLEVLNGRQVIEAARIYLLGGGVYHRKGDNAAAVEWCNQGLAIAAGVGGREGDSVTAHAYSLLGLIYYRLGDMEQTIELCRSSVNIHENVGDIQGASRAYVNLANAYLDRGERGDWNRGIEYYRRALDIQRKIGHVYHQALITVNLGQVYSDRGDLDIADDYYKQSLQMWKELDSPYTIALLHNNMGTVALRRGDTEQALSLFQKSLDMFQEIGSSDFLPEVYRHQAEAHLAVGDLDAALVHAWQSLSMAREQEMRLEEGATRRVLGQIYLKRGEPARAEEELRESLAILSGLNSRYEMGKTHFQLARLYRRLGDEEQMQRHLQEALTVFGELGAALDLRLARRLQEEAD